MIFILLIALTLLVLYGGYILVGMLALSLLTTATILAIMIGLLVALPVLWFRAEIEQWRAKTRSDKLAARAATVRQQLDDEYDRRNGFTPEDRKGIEREEARQRALYD
ncbi:hypothetical protein E2553_46160 [Paraburkholderia dipogonis]|uniref:Uncharacterized protein n=1 Tax=Paraburkholderia dipogonis TaxID=1211383 RepID=A0A4Y8MI02_9BURK|nr:hypothetical protein [Paraburkholderia dipogonis]TFE37003.1 hypothetical protein E2553_46160 [Paraburkholderia dipogonis]